MSDLKFYSVKVEYCKEKKFLETQEAKNYRANDEIGAIKEFCKECNLSLPEKSESCEKSNGEYEIVYSNNDGEKQCSFTVKYSHRKMGRQRNKLTMNTTTQIEEDNNSSFVEKPDLPSDGPSAPTEPHGTSYNEKSTDTPAAEAAEPDGHDEFAAIMAQNDDLPDIHRDTALERDAADEYAESHYIVTGYTKWNDGDRLRVSRDTIINADDYDRLADKRAARHLTHEEAERELERRRRLVEGLDVATNNHKRRQD